MTDCERLGAHVFAWKLDITRDAKDWFPPDGTLCVCGKVKYESDTVFDSTVEGRPKLGIVYDG